MKNNLNHRTFYFSASSKALRKIARAVLAIGQPGMEREVSDRADNLFLLQAVGESLLDKYPAHANCFWLPTPDSKVG